jgi:hypothetical protein
VETLTLRQKRVNENIPSRIAVKAISEKEKGARPTLSRFRFQEIRNELRKRFHNDEEAGFSF